MNIESQFEGVPESIVEIIQSSPNVRLWFEKHVDCSIRLIRMPDGLENKRTHEWYKDAYTILSEDNISLGILIHFDHYCAISCSKVQ